MVNSDSSEDDSDEDVLGPEDLDAAAVSCMIYAIQEERTQQVQTS
jgi:hypothetical protein